MWYIEGSQQLGLGNINYDMQLQGPYNCYWLLTDLERCTLIATESQCRMLVYFRMHSPYKELYTEGYCHLCAIRFCENLVVVSSKINEQNHKL